MHTKEQQYEIYFKIKSEVEASSSRAQTNMYLTAICSLILAIIAHIVNYSAAIGPSVGIGLLLLLFGTYFRYITVAATVNKAKELLQKDKLSWENFLEK